MFRRSAAAAIKFTAEVSQLIVWRLVVGGWGIVVLGGLCVFSVKTIIILNLNKLIFELKDFTRKVSSLNVPVNGDFPR